MKVFPQAHGPTGLYHGDGHVVFLEDIHKDNCWSNDIFVGRSSTPVKDTRFKRSHIVADESVVLAHFFFLQEKCLFFYLIAMEVERSGQRGH